MSALAFWANIILWLYLLRAFELRGSVFAHKTEGA
jgi:hypothetical protein